MRIRVLLTGVMTAAVAALVWNGSALAAEAVTKPIDPAHILAQKFAGGGDSATVPQAVSPPKAKPGPEVAIKPLTETAADKPASAKPAATANTAPPPIAKIGPQRPSLDYEMEMLRRARVEESERKSKAMEALAAAAAASAPKVAETWAAPETANAPLAPAPAVAAPPAPAIIKAAEKPSKPTEPAVIPAPTKIVAPFAATISIPAPTPPAASPRFEKPASSDAPTTTAAVPAPAPGPALPLSAPKAAVIAPPEAAVAPVQAVAAPIPPPATPPAPQLKELSLVPALPLTIVAPTALAEVKPSPSPATVPTSPPVQPTQQATVLLVFESGSAAQDATQSMHDPIVCFDDRCIVSNGFDAAAKALPRGDAQALKTTTGVTLDTCRGKTACVFRDVAITAAPRLQVIDLGSSTTSNAGGGYTTEIDKSCRMSDGELTCDHPLATPDFRVWIVPEGTAKKAGIAALENAIVEGLPQGELVSSADK